MAVCDLADDRARAVAEPIGASAYVDWREMLELEALDALVVCTPPAAHAEPTVAALAAGIHVYVEKPLARTLADGREIVAAWEEGSAVCAVGYQWRALDLLDRMNQELGGREIASLASRSVSPAELGRLESAARTASAERPWFLDPEASGGILFELASHDIDLQMAIAGPVEAVRAVAARVPLAQAGLPARGISDAVSLVLEFAGGGIGTILTAWTGKGLPEFFTLDVLAAKATLVLDLDPVFTLKGTVDGRTLGARAATQPLVRSLARFVEAAGAGSRERVFCTPQDALATLRVALACERAIDERSTVEVVR